MLDFARKSSRISTPLRFTLVRPAIVASGVERAGVAVGPKRLLTNF